MATKMKFEKGKVYEFELEQPKIIGMKHYFMLTYGPEKAKTIPGYENDNLQFRAEVLECQTNWNRMPQGTKIPCFVQGYIYDAGTPTDFPFLVQDRSYILKQYYTQGGTYTFTIAELQKNTDSTSALKWYTLTDGYGLKHSYPTDKELEPGSEITLSVDKITHKLEFVNEVKKKIQENFKVGEEYEFEIVGLQNDPSKLKYFILKDFICNYSVHRFCYERQLSVEDVEGTEDKEPKYQIGSKIKLQVQKFMANGWPCLTLPKKKFNETQLKSLEKLPIGLIGLENNTREYKSSIVYTGEGKQDIDEQLGFVIMKEIASFMNSSGGTLILGVRDDGIPVGIEQDLPLLQTGDLPQDYKYPPTLDNYERRIRLMVINVLGGTANSLLDNSFEFTTVTDEDTTCTICTIKIPRSVWPIYMNGATLYKRCGNMCQRLLGNDITFFIRERMLGVDVKQPEPAAIINLPKTTEPIVELPFATKPVPAEEKDKTIQILPKSTLSGKGFYCTFLKKENRFWRDTKPYKDQEDILHEIFVDNEYKKATGYLLMCYANGRVRFQNPGIILKGRPQKRHLYANGYSTEAEFQKVLVGNKKDCLVVRSTDAKGQHWIKAVPLWVYNYASRADGASLASIGNMIVNENLAKVESMEIVPEESCTYIIPIIQKYRTTTPGFPSDDLRYAAAVTYLDNRVKI